MADPINIHTAVPTNAKVRHIAGDWMVDGYIDNLNRPSRLEVLVMNGKMFEVDAYGYVEREELTLDSDGCLKVAGASIGFSPDAGELERIGTAI